MQRSTFWYLPGAVLSAFVVSAAFAAQSSSVKIDGSVVAADACARQGGVVSRASDGTICTTPPRSCVSRRQSGASYAVDPNNVSLVAECLDACGKVVAGTDGTATCKIHAAVERHDVPYGPEAAPIAVVKPSGQPR